MTVDPTEEVGAFRPLGVVVVGAGYWGPNLARNFSAIPACDLRPPPSD
jgi:hypothetical protein